MRQHVMEHLPSLYKAEGKPQIFNCYSPQLSQNTGEIKTGNTVNSHYWGGESLSFIKSGESQIHILPYILGE